MSFLLQLTRMADWMLSANEIANADWRLLALDKDNSGALINQELVMPESSFGGRFGGGGFGGGRFGASRNTNFTDPAEIDPRDGLASLPDREAFEASFLSGRRRID